MSKQVWMRLGLLGCTLLVLGNARPAAAEWYDLVKVYGDLRYRLESFQDESQTGAGKSWYRDRDRVRARIGAQATIDDYWKADFRMATDEPGISKDNPVISGDPVSTNQTLGDSETRKPLWVDLAYIEYKVLFNNGKFVGGKMKNPFEVVGGSQLVWDSDLTPEGWSGNFSLDLTPDTKAFLNTGGFWIRENSANIDPQMYGAQAVIKTKLDALAITAGFGYFDYVNTISQAPFDFKGTSTTGYGNTITNFKYANNYMLGEGILALSQTVMDLPVTLYADWVLNNGANHFNRAYLVGLVLNKAKNEGSWEFGYNFRQLEKDSVVGAFCDSDFAGGGTNADGHQAYVTYVPADGVKTSLTFFRDRKNLDKTLNPFYNRFQADVVLSF
jgi:hypothetical protein